EKKWKLLVKHLQTIVGHRNFVEDLLLHAFIAHDLKDFSNVSVTNYPARHSVIHHTANKFFETYVYNLIVNSSQVTDDVLETAYEHALLAAKNLEEMKLLHPITFYIHQIDELMDYLIKDKLGKEPEDTIYAYRIINQRFRNNLQYANPLLLQGFLKRLQEIADKGKDYNL